MFVFFMSLFEKNVQYILVTPYIMCTLRYSVP